MAKDAVLAPGAVQVDSPSRLDEAGFHEFYRLHAQALWSYLYRLSGNAADADDLLQETCCRLLRAPVAAQPLHELRAYTFRIASNLVVDHWRRVGRRREDAIPVPEKSATPDLALRHDMERTFARLNVNERAMLWLAYVEGASHEEIADALRIKPRSVRVLLFRARRKLAGLLQQAGWAKGGS